MPKSPEDIPDQSRTSGLLLRPTQTLQDLPLAFRWEVTRRHPYYQLNWARAHKLHAGELQDSREVSIGQVAVMLLLGIGMTGDPPPPSAGWDSLTGGQLAAAWEDGAVGPVTYRGIAGLLLTSLPRETRRFIGEWLVRSSEIDQEHEYRRYDLMLECMTRKDPALDSMPTRPLIGINVNSPQRTIVAAVEKCTRQWKQQAGVEERRRRDDSIGDCLYVWDQREGWVDDHYDIKCEQTFQQISDRLSIPRRTAASRYYTAFRLVSGHDYNFANWVTLFLGLKLDKIDGIASLRRHKSTVSPRSAAAPGQEDQPAIDGGSQAPLPKASPANFTARDMPETAEILTDIAALVDKGRSDQQILEIMEFENPDASRQLIDYVRSRRNDPTS